MRHRELLGLAVVALVAFQAAAHASPSSRLVYSRAPEVSTCPDESELRKAVASRFGYDPFFPWAKQTVVVQILRARGHYIARVQLLDVQGIAHGMRELSSNQGDCSEIFEAAALAVSIALDAPAKPLTQEATAEGQSAPPPPPIAETPAPAPQVGPPRPPIPSAAATAEGATPAKPEGAERMHIDVGGDLLGSVGATPAITPGASAFVRGRLQMWSLALELRADWPEVATRPVEIGGGSVRAWMIAGELAPCLRVGIFAPCAVVEVGSLQAAGLDIDPRSSKTALVLAAGTRMEFEWPLTQSLSVRGRVEGLANLFQATLLLGQDVVWSAPPVAGSLGAGVAARLP